MRKATFVEAAEAFDGCPNRQLLNSQAANGVARLRCPKYPDSMIFIDNNSFENVEERGKAALRAGCLGCKYSTEVYEPPGEAELVERLHPAIAEGCGPLFLNEHYPEAALHGFKMVRDRLRGLTGFERAAEAFGRGGLRIEGVPEHLDSDLQEAARYLMMSIDKFRNIGSHTSDQEIAEGLTGSAQSYAHLNLSSLAMHLLDRAAMPGEAAGK